MHTSDSEPQTRHYELNTLLAQRMYHERPKRYGALRDAQMGVSEQGTHLFEQEQMQLAFPLLFPP